MRENHTSIIIPNRYSASLFYTPKVTVPIGFIYFLCLLLLAASSCQNPNKDSQSPVEPKSITYSCTSLPTQFQSYDEAKASILHASFPIADAVNTSKSSWIRGASYYSCDGKSGYFLLKTDKKDYLFQDMLLEVWEGFKGADSFGKYYNAYIRDRYYMYVGQR